MFLRPQKDYDQGNHLTGWPIQFFVPDKKYNFVIIQGAGSTFYRYASPAVVSRKRFLVDMSQQDDSSLKRCRPVEVHRTFAPTKLR